MTAATLSRRSFFAGLGAAIVASALPIGVARISVPSRVLPVIRLRESMGWPFTIHCLHRALTDLFEQVSDLEPFNPSEIERKQMAAQIDDQIGQIRPIGVQVLIETPFENMLRGEFTIHESGPGTVVIS